MRASLVAHQADVNLDGPDIAGDERETSHAPQLFIEGIHYLAVLRNSNTRYNWSLI